jgi:tetratricopeptide (TPR) repeat protein
VRFDLNGKVQSTPAPAEIEQKLSGDERDAELLLKLGWSYKERQDVERAMAAFQKAVVATTRRIEREPRNARLYLVLSDALRAVDREAEARAAIRKCLELDPKHADGWKAAYWLQWSDLVKFVHDSRVTSWTLTLGEAPPPITRKLTEAETAKAQRMLREAWDCHVQWKRLADETLENLSYAGLIEGNWEIYEARLRQKDVRQEDSALTKMFLSAKMSEMLTKFGESKADPDALGAAFMMKMWAIESKAANPEWKPSQISRDEKKSLLAIQAAAERLTIHRDAAIARKAWLALVYTDYLTLDFATARQRAHDALKAMPKDRDIVHLMFFVQSDDKQGEPERFWLEHLRRYPSAPGWAHLGNKYFRAKRFADAEVAFTNAARLDPNEPTMLLGKVSLLLRRQDGLVEADQLLHTLDKLAVESDDERQIAFVPKLAESCRYLRAVHTALSGKWEKGRDELVALRDRDVLVEAIDQAMEAFPRRLMASPPAGRLDGPVPVNPKQR